METASPNPFNGAEMFNGQPHRRAPAHPFDDEDFGPETDVDMVDDVLLSPAIAAAKALVHGANEDDYERQRQQMKEFDEPGDLERSRDTPTPPAHEVARDVSADNLAESGGEESEEEWNYIPGKDTKNTAPAEADSKQDQEDMSSQLNPNAAEFVPVSPTRLGPNMDDTTIASSPRHGFEKSLDHIELPSELEFSSEISRRPGDLEYSNGPKDGDDFFMRDNFSTLLNKSKEFSIPTDCSELAHKPVINFTSENSQEHVPFDKLAAVQNIEEKVTSGVLQKAANIFGTNNDFSNNAFATNIFGKGDPMTESFMGKDFASTPETEDDLIPGTPRSTTVEAPGSPILPTNHQTELDSPEDFTMDTQKSPDLISPGDGPHEGLTSGQERTSSSGFESESGAEEVEANLVSGNDDGFITEHRRSPPLDLSFKPIQTFSDTNPFGALQTPSSNTPIDQFDIPLESQEQTQPETPKKASEKPGVDHFDFMSNTPSSFISRRSPMEEPVVPFDKLESPTDVPHFAHPPNANSSFLATELPESPENSDVIGALSPVKSEPIEPEVHVDYETNVNNMAQNLFSDDSNPEMQETSFTTENNKVSETSHVDLDTTEGFLTTESKIMQDENECEEMSKLVEGLKVENDQDHLQKDDISSSVSPKVGEQVLAAIDNIKVENEEAKHGECKDSDTEVETKEMKLEFESSIANSQPTPEELKNIDESFEVISKDELAQGIDVAEVPKKDIDSHDDSIIIIGKESSVIDLTKGIDTAEVPKENLDSHDASLVIMENETEVVDLTSPIKETNPFKMDDDFAANDSLPTNQEIKVDAENSTNNELFSAIDKFSSAVEESLVSSEHISSLSSSEEPHSQVEPVASKTVSYQTLTPANEPQITKMESYITGEEEKETSLPEDSILDTTKAVETSSSVEEEIKQVDEKEVSLVPEENISPTVIESLQKSEPVQSTVVTETLITALEETSEVPSIVTTEVPSRTPPPTPAPGLDDSKEFQDIPKTDILVAAVAAAGAVAAGSAIIAEKEIKKGKDAATAKKTTVSATKKPSDASSKPSAKPATASKAPAAKPTGTKTTTTTTKPATAAPKSATASTTTKPAPAKTAASNLAAKKPSAPPGKPVPPKTTTSVAPKPPTTTSSKPVPKQLSVNKTAPATLKPPSKPTTPTSKPTTPTTPKSPIAKSDLIKSPPRPGLKSSITTKTSAPKPAADKSTEKKPLTNGDIKPITKKAEVPKKPTAPTTKPVATTKPAVSSTKSTGSVASRAPTSTTNKTAAPKPTVGSTTTAKPKPTSTASSKPSAPAPIKRPTTAPPAKTADKTGKETANRQISSAKPAMNGKSATTKSAVGAKKTDPKAVAKPGTKPPPIKKPEEAKVEEEKPAQIQEGDITTTNGYADHFEEQQDMEIEDLAPVIIETVN